MECYIFDKNVEKPFKIRAGYRIAIEWKGEEKKPQAQHDKSNQFTIHAQQRLFPLHNIDFSNSRVIFNLPLSSSKTSITDEHHLPHASIKLLTALGL